MINKRFLYFRMQQTSRFVKEFPVPYFLVFLLLIGIGCYICYGWIVEIQNAFGVAGITSVLLLYIHLKRKDYHFICLIEEHPRKVFLADYLLLASPVWVLLLLRQQWHPALLLIVAGITVSFIKQPFRRTRSGIPVPSLLPFDAFEIRSGFRSFGTGMIFFYVAAWAGLFIPYLTLGLLWLYTGGFQICFSSFESTAILLSQENNTPAQFLKNKLKLNLLLYGATLLPVCIVYTIIYPGQWWVILYYLVFSLLNIMLMIVTKYAYYIPGKKLVNGQIGNGFSFMGIILPFFAPVTFLFLVRYYHKAISQLKPYLNAYHR